MNCEKTYKIKMKDIANERSQEYINLLLNSVKKGNNLSSPIFAICLEKQLCYEITTCEN